MILGLGHQLALCGFAKSASPRAGFDTPLFRGATSKDPPPREDRRTILMGRLGQPSDIGWAMTYLASPAANYVTGHITVVDGGALHGFKDGRASRRPLPKLALGLLALMGERMPHIPRGHGCATSEGLVCLKPNNDLVVPVDVARSVGQHGQGIFGIHVESAPLHFLAKMRLQRRPDFPGALLQGRKGSRGPPQYGVALATMNPRTSISDCHWPGLNPRQDLRTVRLLQSRRWHPCPPFSF